VAAFAFMEAAVIEKKNHGTRRRPYRIRCRHRSYTVNKAQWQEAVDAHWLVPVDEAGNRAHVACLANGVGAQMVNRELVLFPLGPSIQSTWKAFEQAWRERYGVSKARDLDDSLFERRRRALVERQAEIDLDALLWRFSLRGKRANSFSYLSEDQQREILDALRPAAKIAEV